VVIATYLKHASKRASGGGGPSVFPHHYVNQNVLTAAAYGISTVRVHILYSMILKIHVIKNQIIDRKIEWHKGK
jgi:hypothetical protein